jgi:hypothetical protein
MSEAARQVPRMRKMATRKISGGAGLVFEGLGLHTDYGKDGKGPRKADAADKPARAEAGGGPGGQVGQGGQVGK